MDQADQYFFDDEGDRRMEKQNGDRWDSIAQHITAAIKRGYLSPRPLDILDVGCHTGGMLMLLRNRFDSGIKSLSGVEPLARAREIAGEKLPAATLFGDLKNAPSQSIDVVVSHEMLYLVEDLSAWIQELKRVLRKDGGAFISLGSHGENTAWLRWRNRLRELYGHVSFVHQPMEILRTGETLGFEMEIKNLFLEKPMSYRYSPPENGWGEFISLEEMINFHERWKYVFIFYPTN